MSMLTLAHLSDPHLAPLPQPRWNELIGKRITGYINWQKKRRLIHDPAVLAKVTADLRMQAADHIAVTGDLANIGLAAEYAKGRDWLETLGSTRDVTLVPGNHDIYVRESAKFATRHWNPYMSDDDGVAGFPFVRRRGNVALIGLSSGVPTAPFLATGWLGATQTAELAMTLHKLKSEDVFRVLLIHHPPVTKSAQQNWLMDARILLRVIAMNGAELLLHGHDHLHMVNWLDGPDGTRVPAVGVPSASLRPGNAKDAAAYNLYRIDGAPGAWQCELISRGLGEASEIVEQKRLKLLGPGSN